MDKVRAKFRVQELKKYVGSAPKAGGGWENAILDGVVLMPVTGGTPENEGFFLATPSGRIEMNVTNPAVVGFFEPGAEYYVEFAKATE